MKIIVCLLAIFVIGNCQNEFIDEAQDVEENSDLQERSEDEAQYFDPEELSNIEERSDDIEEAEDIDDEEDTEDREERSETDADEETEDREERSETDADEETEDREERSETDADEETEDMEQESTIEERSSDGNIKYLERLAALKSLWGQWVIAKKNFRDEIEACRKKNNLVPSGNCRKCWGGCRVRTFRPFRRCDCGSVCKAYIKELKKVCNIDGSKIRVIRRLIRLAKIEVWKANGRGRFYFGNRFSKF